MPTAKGNACSAAEPAESDEKVDFDGEENDPEELTDEEFEYEEVEEEEEVEIEEEVEEVEEGEEEEEEEEDNTNNAGGANAYTNIGRGETMVADADEKKKHAELLARPPHGSEVYIGGIPHDASEEDLRGFCESVGEVTEVRIMKGKDSSENKGFAFVSFRSVDLASKAIDELNNTDFKGKKIKCSTSQSKHRLFLGNVPRSWREEDLRKVVTEVGPGVTTVELAKDMKSSSNNRGFAFVGYYNNACADYSRQKMMSPKFRLGDNAPTVSWADPKNADSSASQVKAIYVKNLPKDVTQNQLEKLFEHHGKITKVVLPPAKSGQEMNRIGFVHFAERSSAMNALKNTEKYELDGQVLECSLAKPLADQKSVGGAHLQNLSLLPNYPPRLGYGMVGGSFGALGAGYGAAGFAQPLFHGGGPTPAGMAMMPMLLPDGRIGYVLQQHGAPPHTQTSHQRNNRSGGGGGNRSGGSSSKSRHSNVGSHGQKYRPY